jgi:hypothetical protein
MGPGPPKKNGGSKNASQRALNTAGQGSSYAGSTAMSSDPPSSPTAVTEGSRLSGEGWNRKRYQREDEALWGHDYPGPGQRIMDAIAKAGSSAGRLLESRLSKSGSLKEEESPSTYYLGKNPPVNDLHPPVVSTAPSSRDETRWMLQPPPPAKIMEGKERANRSRAGSNGSSRRGVEDTPLSRQVTERLVDAKLQRGETPYFESRPLPAKSENRGTASSTTNPKPRQLERDRSSSLESSGSLEAAIKRKQKPPPISVSTSSRSSWDTIEHIPIPATPPPAARPEMSENTTGPFHSTIISSSCQVPQDPNKDDDHKPLRELTPPSNSAMNTRTSSPPLRLSPSVNAMPASIPSVETKTPSAATYQFPKYASGEDPDPTNENL